jgi:hypothetical protein
MSVNLMGFLQKKNVATPDDSFCLLILTSFWFTSKDNWGVIQDFY